MYRTLTTLSGPATSEVKQLIDAGDLKGAIDYLRQHGDGTSILSEFPPWGMMDNLHNLNQYIIVDRYWKPCISLVELE